VSQFLIFSYFSLYANSLIVEELSPLMHAFVLDESTYVCYSLSYILMGDPFLLPPVLSILKLLVADVEFAGLSEVLANVVST
jgi:hypothetical protein